MAYSRAKSHSLRGSSRYGKKKRGGVRRRYGVKKRTYRKKASSKMSKRRILDIATNKKRDVMVPVTNPTLDPTIPSTPRPAVFSVGRPVPPGTPAYTYCIPWIATYRRPVGVGNDASQALLTHGSPFYRGLSENVTISVTGPTPWQWRRVCFTFKGDALLSSFTTLQGADTILHEPDVFFRNTFTQDTGVFRPMYDIASYYGKNQTQPSTPGTTPASYFRILNTIFRGVSAQQAPTDVTNIDYINVMTAKTDNTDVTIKYDKTVTIASGNEAGIQRNHKRYHPMNKTLVYSNLEQGNQTIYGARSTDSKPGMGDYYVLDFFQARYLSQADEGDLVFDPRATLYWHEK